MRRQIDGCERHLRAAIRPPPRAPPGPV